MLDMVTPLPLLPSPAAAAVPVGWTMDTSWCVTTLRDKPAAAHTVRMQGAAQEGTCTQVKQINNLLHTPLVTLLMQTP
jgi:hypothetical protein